MQICEKEVHIKRVIDESMDDSIELGLICVWCQLIRFFFFRMLELQSNIKKSLGKNLTPRDLDGLLLDY